MVNLPLFLITMFLGVVTELCPQSNIGPAVTDNGAA